ncbi:hypothetical protein [Streptomyces subrutilus]|uniref:hypothetical protein n=1 Tax=Streptomyces subrutilus TaxID=36818 RepID=UPI001E3AECBF|nr:hypothetical protein [Streptomyces subrutilus]
MTVEQVDDPAAIGKHPSTRGFPSCTAVVDYPGPGYRALFGWVQLVRSTDNSSAGDGFDMDPFCLFEDAPSPYAFFGVNPTLFDAPSRDPRQRLDWTAHSYLAWTPLDETERRVLPVAGFSWGFGVGADGRVAPHAVRALAPADWAGHLPRLRAACPGWVFDGWRPEP